MHRMQAATAPALRTFSEKRWLQGAVAIAGVVPVAAGLQGVLRGVGRLDPDGSASLDSHYRYLSGLLLGIGLLFWSAIPRIDQKGELVRALTVAVVIGGIGRALSLYQTGLPSAVMRLALIMELVVTPVLCLWQWRLARRVDGTPAPR